MARFKTREARRKARQRRVRKTIGGTAQRPRLAVFRSARHIYAQAIDDEQGRTLASASTRDKSLQDKLKGYTGNRDSAVRVGQAIAERLKAQGVTVVVFDRGGNRYHGRVRALADSAREAGLKF